MIRKIKVYGIQCPWSFLSHWSNPLGFSFIAMWQIKCPDRLSYLNIHMYYIWIKHLYVISSVNTWAGKKVSNTKVIEDEGSEVHEVMTLAFTLKTFAKPVHQYWFLWTCNPGAQSLNPQCMGGQEIYLPSFLL